IVVENGSAFDKAEVDMGNRKKLVVPTSFEVVRGGKGAKVQLLMKKTLAFHWRPPEPMSIRTARGYIACAVEHEGEAHGLASFGEWGSKEGGAYIKVVAIVPEDLQVEAAEQSSREHDGDGNQNGGYLTKPKEVTDGYWYGAASPSDGWTRISNEPD